MTDQLGQERPPAAGLLDVRWQDVWSGYAISVVGTAVLGSVLFLLDRNVWWVSIASMAGLAAGGFAAGLRARQTGPLNGALLASVFFGTEAAILMIGTAAEGTAIKGLPDPLPGLAIGDSIFFFVSPLGQLGSAVLGSLLGGRWAQRTPAPRPTQSEALGSGSADASPSQQ